MMRRLVAAVLFAMPLIELAVAVAVGRAVGAGWTVLSLAVLTIAGAIVVKSQGSRAFRELRDAARARRTPALDLPDRAVVVAGGLLLFMPGFVTALLSLPFLLPGTRPLIRGFISRWFVRRGSMQMSAASVRGTHAVPPRQPRTSDPRVVPGEVIDET
ncbi:MAG: FxsA family protein [Nocardioidaceae bacterium]|nr:FxsA family protein [Nocardioidaceae bacterium]